MTWESPDGTRAVRFMLPATVYKPGKSAASPLPADYLAYLLGQDTAGVHYTDQTSVMVDGEPGTIFTATSDRNLDGSIGCSEEQMTPGDCFGFQPDLVASGWPSSTAQTIRWWRGCVVLEPATPATSATLEVLRGLSATVRFTPSDTPTATSTSGSQNDANRRGLGGRLVPEPSLLKHPC